MKASTAQAPEAKHRTHQVTIYVDSQTGKFHYDPGWSVHVKRLDTVIFNCQYSYAVLFGERSPFQDRNVSAPANGRIERQVRPDATSGSYKYSVAVFLPGRDRPFSDDPEIWID